jgi:hypothetical protein
MGMIKKAKVSEVPPVPELPKTSVNPQPRNEASPVAPAKVVKAVERAGDDKILNEKMTKADWGAKDRSIAMLALIADVYKSPVVAQQAVGHNDAEVLALIDKHFTHALKLYEDNK